VGAGTPQGEKKNWGAEFMGLSCKCTSPPRGRECTPREGGVSGGGAVFNLGGISYSEKNND